MIVLRPATIRDAEFLLQLRNEERVRAMSGCPDEIGLGTHLAWLESRLNLRRPHATFERLYILTGNDRTIPIGMGRIDCEDIGWDRELQTCSLHYAIDTPWRGQGYGRQLISLLVEEAKTMGYEIIKVRIKRENTASIICAAVGGVNAVEFL